MLNLKYPLMSSVNEDAIACRDWNTTSLLQVPRQIWHDVFPVPVFSATILRVRLSNECWLISRKALMKLEIILVQKMVFGKIESLLMEQSLIVLPIK